MAPTHAKQVAAALMAGLLLAVAPAYAVADSEKAGAVQLARDLDKLGQNLCKSLDLKCAKSKAPAPPPVAKPNSVKASMTVKPKPPLVIPIPRSKPADLAGKPPETEPAPVPSPLPGAKPSPEVALLPSAPAGKPVVKTPGYAMSGEDCLAALRMSSVEFEALATPVGNGSCHVDVPVRLLFVSTPRGRVELPEKPTLNCRFAHQFALWLSDAGAAIVAARMNSPLAKVSTGPGYECRGRNGDSSAKLSAHAFGNAVDISTIDTADGRTVRIADASVIASPAFPLLRGLRMSACGYFSTVLGPGANAAHASHFHFDMELHGKNNAYRICQ